VFYSPGHNKTSDVLSYHLKFNVSEEESTVLSSGSLTSTSGTKAKQYLYSKYICIVSFVGCGKTTPLVYGVYITLFDMYLTSSLLDSSLFS